MSDFAAINANVLILFALFLIIFLLMYIAFGKSEKPERRHKKSTT